MRLNTGPPEWLSTLKLLGIGLAVGAGIGYYLLVDRPAATRRRSETPALELAYREHPSEGLVILFLVAKGRVQRVYVGGMSEVQIHAFIGEIIE